MNLVPKVIKTIMLSMVITLTLGQPSMGAADSIKVGAPIPQTGPFASDGTVMEKSIKLAINDINESGGLLGKQVEMLAFDIGDLTPDKLQAAATNLVDRNKVDAVITGYGGFGPDIPAFCPRKVPYLHADAFSSVLALMHSMNCTNIFNVGDVEVSYGKAQFDQIMKLGYEFPTKKLALIYGPYEWETGITQAIAESAEALGWEVVVSEEVPYESIQWQGILSKMRSAGPSLVHIELIDPSLIKPFVQQFRQNPIPGSLLNVGYVAAVPAFGDVLASGDADGVLAMTLSAQLPGPDGDAFENKWKTAYGESPPWGIAALVYDTVRLWAAAVEQAGTATDYAAVNKAIMDIRYQGVTGVLDVNDQYKIPLGDDTQPPFLFQAQGTDLVPLFVGSKKVGEFQVPSWNN